MFFETVIGIEIRSMEDIGSQKSYSWKLNLV